MTAFLLPRIQTSVLLFIENTVQRCSQRSRWMKASLTVVLFLTFALIFWLLREEIFFLGDGYYLIRSVREIHIAQDIPFAFIHEPFSGFLIWKFHTWLAVLLNGSSPQLAYQVSSIILGIISLAVTWKIASAITAGGVDKLLCTLFILGGGGCQLFFGYVENYSFSYAILLVYIVLTLWYFDGKVHPVVPSIALGALVALHFAMAIIVPSLALICWQELRKKRYIHIPLLPIVTILVTGVLLWMSGDSFERLSSILITGHSFIVPMREITERTQAYTMFSTYHILDLINSSLLLFPAVILLSPVIISSSLKLIRSQSLQDVFLLTIGILSLVYIILVNSEIGMSRDWDMLAPFGVGVTIATGYVLFRGGLVASLRRQMIVMVLGIVLCLIVSWISINARAEASQARFDLLEDTRLWGKNALALSYEERAIYLREQGNLLKSLDYYYKYLDMCPPGHAGRIWSSIAGIYRILGDTSKLIESYNKIIELGPKKGEVYFQLVSLYAERQNYNAALGILDKAIEANPQSAMAYHLAGTYLIKLENPCERALPYFLKAIRADNSYADAYLSTGLCYYHLEKYSEMKPYLEKYLLLRPDDPQASTLKKYVNLHP